MAYNKLGNGLAQNKLLGAFVAQNKLLGAFVAQGWADPNIKEKGCFGPYIFCFEKISGIYIFFYSFFYSFFSGYLIFYSFSFYCLIYGFF